LGDQELSGVSRARKLAAIREYFRSLVVHRHLPHSSAEGVETPKREKNTRTYLLPDEYNRMLALAGSHARDYAILQAFLQTGIRVSELCGLTLDDVDLPARSIKVVDKGMVTREIELEKKAILAIKRYLEVRGDSLDSHLFLNRYGQPLGECGVRKLVVDYKTRAGITKKIGPHSFRHTFGTLKAQKGVSPFQLKEWLGHARLDTTQIYVHMGKQNAKKVMEATSL
jgi:integrase/recombinase XerD